MSLETEKVGQRDPAESEMIAQALNEHGFLFQDLVRQFATQSQRPGSRRLDWTIEAEEYPVSVQGAKSTRIDLILKPSDHRVAGWRMLVECKRASPDYKRWIFFGPDERGKFMEFAMLSSHKPPAIPIRSHELKTNLKLRSPVFRYYLEGKLAKGSRMSASEAIEEALYQVTLGQAGLSIRIAAGDTYSFGFIPVVVTTAQLCIAHYDLSKISNVTGQIAPQDLEIEKVSWLAVNYHVSDVVGRQVPFSAREQTDLNHELNLRFIRTVHVVQAEHFETFLKEADLMLP